MPISPHAGKPPARDMLVDLSKLEREYYERKPDINESSCYAPLSISRRR